MSRPGRDGHCCPGVVGAVCASASPPGKLVFSVKQPPSASNNKPKDLFRLSKMINKLLNLLIFFEYT
jgi:hypothetical protein